MSTKSVLEVLEEVLGVPPENRQAVIRLMMHGEVVQAMRDPTTRESLFKCFDRMSELNHEDKDMLLDFLHRQNMAATASVMKNESPEPESEDETFSAELAKEQVSRSGMMDKARQFISGLPTGAKLTPISICKRAGINPANMYQLCRSLADEGVLEKVAFAKYKVVNRSNRKFGGETMQLAEQVASMRPKRAYHRRTPPMSPRAYIEALPKNKVFKLKKVKKATRKNWNSVTATACLLSQSGVIKRKARGVYVRV